MKPLAPCQQCEPNDILYLLHTYFTDDSAACARRHYVMLFSRLKYACPGTATLIMRVSEPDPGGGGVWLQTGAVTVAPGSSLNFSLKV